MGHRRLAYVGLGHGVFGIDCIERQRPHQPCVACPVFSPSRLVGVHWFCGGVVGVSSADGALGKSCALGIYCLHRVVDCSAVAIHRQKRQRGAPLDKFWVHQFSTV